MRSRHVPERREDIAAVLFDLDGTLLDHATAARDAVVALHRRYQPDLGALTADEAVAGWRGAEEHWFARYLAGAFSFTEQRRRRIEALWALAGAEPCSPAESDKAFDFYLAAYEAAWRSFPDVAPALDRLSGLILGVVTNGDATQQRRKLDALGVRDRFAEVVISSEIGLAKPDPAIYRHAAEQIGLQPERCVYVGDRADVDAEAASAAGLHGVWLDRAGTGVSSAGVTSVSSLTALADVYAADRDGALGR